MNFIFGKPRIAGDELVRCLNYLEEEWKLSIFQEKAAEIYNNTLMAYGSSVSKDRHAATEMRRAADYLAQAAAEILRRRDKMVRIPDVASAMYSAWQKTYVDYAGWTKAQYAAIIATANGTDPDANQIQELFAQAERSRERAEDEESKLLKRLKLDDAEMQRLLDKATAAVATESWQPQIAK
ncbi:MAG: hypothetical protein PHU08_04840 [Dehalococcoidales bacterium]|nr:hypothetical protein [Dehalococcoidales bacterium]